MTQINAHRLKRATDKSHSPDGSKTQSQIQRDFLEWAEVQPTTTRCAIWRCEWEFRGTAAEGKQAFLEHRAAEHPTADRIARNEAKRTPKRKPPRQMRDLEEDEPVTAVEEASERMDDAISRHVALTITEPRQRLEMIAAIEREANGLLARSSALRQIALGLKSLYELDQEEVG